MSRPRPPSTTKSDFCTLPSCLAPVSGDFRCPDCNVASYCHLIHALLCLDARLNFTDAERHGLECPAPSQPAEVRKINFLLFPVDASTPRIVQVDCRVLRKTETGGEEDHDVNWHKLLGGGPIHGFLAHSVGHAQPMSSSAPSSRLFLAFSQRLPSNGTRLPVNLCAQNLTGSQSRQLWTGTLVGYRVREPAEPFTQFLDVSMADLPQFVAFFKDHRCSIPRNPSIRSVAAYELLTMLARQASRAFKYVYPDFSSTVADFVARERTVPREYPTTPCTRAQKELGVQSEMLKKVIQEEVRAAIWETGITIVGVPLGGYALWRLVFSPSISFFLAVFMFFLRAPLALMKLFLRAPLALMQLFLWPLTLFTFALA
ncbi:hypothetical protein LXA43DRAFT_1057993 [Ganoderma leucocontextum]|nr:hypothetical protein LXA43DRAFT_1057993 [Ganoderma leucocontextum]